MGSAVVLAAVSSSNHVGRMDLTPIAALEFRHLKLKMASVKGNINDPKQKEMPRRQKKISQ